MQPSTASDQAHHKAMLSAVRTTPKPDQLPALNTGTNLAPLTSASCDRSQPSTSMEFLSNLEQLRILDTQKSTRDGATLFVVEVYMLSPTTSNIPTMHNSSSMGQLRPVASVSGVSTNPTASTSEHEAPECLPDLCVRRRFSDFSQLRHEAIAVSCINAHFLCQYCRQFQTYTRFHAAQPLWFVRLVTTKKQQKKILVQFLDDLVDFSQSRARRDRHCRLRQTLPKLIEDFLTE
ncbi:hypothetical protein P3T76_012571 [Phytophthora citrophthora]|uniref:PX domain-containing protein n=1 Tax=Phytophthora citrophthora TaxID=4793 RepID=A0AAD9G4M4_9STRA|nr:hypothetical protein P3T76_012571 [Phytophthora citrophthora]